MIKLADHLGGYIHENIQKTFETLCRNDRTRVYVVEINGNEVRDCQGNFIFYPGVDRVLFLDFHPDANWTHDCAYVRLDPLYRVAMATPGSWPPALPMRELQEPDEVIP